MSGWIFLGCTSTKQGLMCLAQGHNVVMPERLKSTTPQSQVKHSTTEPVRSLSLLLMLYFGSKGMDCVKSESCYSEEL